MTYGLILVALAWLGAGRAVAHEGRITDLKAAPPDH